MATENPTSTTLVSLKIIEALATHQQGLGVTQLGQLLGMPKARIHRHLTTLRDNGYLTQDPRTSHYQIGWQFYMMSRRCVEGFDVMTFAHSEVETLRNTLGLTVVVSSFTDTQVVVTNIMNGTNQLEISLRLGSRFELNSVAQGKIVLAFGPAALAESYLAMPLPFLTPHTVTSSEKLRTELALIRQRGWADAPEELYVGINAMSAPLFQASGRLFGTIAIIGSIHYLPKEPSQRNIDALLTASRDVSRIMGYQGDFPF